MDKFGNTVSSRFNGFCFTGGENDAHDLFDLGRGTGETDPFRRGIDHSGIQFSNKQSAGLKICLGFFELVSFNFFCKFAGDAGALEFHDASGVHGTGQIGINDSQQGRGGRLKDLVTAFDRAADSDFSIGDIFDFFNVAELGDIELFGDLGTDLCGIAVDGLTSAEDEITSADVFGTAAERIAGGEGIGTGECAVGDQNGTRRCLRP